MIASNRKQDDRPVPIVLHHGILGFPGVRIGPMRLEYYRGIDRALERLGHPVIVTRVHPTASIATRAAQLREIILRQMDARGYRRVVIVGHSMGGLDARYMISRLGMVEHVAALLTVTTPHRGSPYADWCQRHLGRLGAWRLARSIGLDVGAVEDLTTGRFDRFNRENPDSPHVRYFSVSAARPWHRVPPFAIHSHRIIAAAEGDNDGLVSVRSAVWGTHLGTWPADHWHTINHRMVIEGKRPTGDIVPFYLEALRRMGVIRGSDAEETRADEPNRL